MNGAWAAPKPVYFALPDCLNGATNRAGSNACRSVHTSDSLGGSSKRECETEMMHEALPPDQLPSLAKATAHVNKLLISIRAAHDAGKRKKADHLVCRYLASFDARYLAVLEACKRKGVKQDASTLPDSCPLIERLGWERRGGADSDPGETGEPTPLPHDP